MSDAVSCLSSLPFFLARPPPLGPRIPLGRTLWAPWEDLSLYPLADSALRHVSFVYAMRGTFFSSYPFPRLMLSSVPFGPLQAAPRCGRHLRYTMSELRKAQGCYRFSQLHGPYDIIYPTAQQSCVPATAPRTKVTKFLSLEIGVWERSGRGQDQ